MYIGPLTELDICSLQSREGELRDFDSNTFQCLEIHCYWGNRKPYYSSGCHRNKVNIQCLGDKRERAGHTEVALDDLQFVILGNQLDIKWTCAGECVVGIH